MVFTRTKPPSGYYVYSYLRKSDLTPYYIGKGKADRAWNKHKNVSVPEDISKIQIIKSNLTEEEAFNLETKLILEYGRKNNKSGILHNKTDGGEGNSGWIPTKETRKKLSEAFIGKPLKKEHREKISVALTGKKLSEKTKKKISTAASNISEETRAKMREAKKGRKLSEEHRANISQKLKGKVLSEETKQKMRKPKPNKENYKGFTGTHSEETKEKISRTKKTKK